MSFYTNIKEEQKQPINFIASIVTIANAFLSYKIVSHDGSSLTFQYVQIDNMAIGLIIACIFEACLASFFGWFIVVVSSYGRGLPLLLSIAIMLISAWLTIFNIQWLILSHSPKTGIDITILIVFSFLFAGFSLYLIDVHLNLFKEKFESIKKTIKNLGEVGVLITWQILCFIVMLIIAISHSPYVMT